jgi:hypothetical protein
VPVQAGSRDQALNELTTEFYTVPVRIVIAIFQGYLDQYASVRAAVEATRARIIDACIAA